MSATNPQYRPAVKYQKINSDILEKLQSSQSFDELDSSDSDDSQSDSDSEGCGNRAESESSTKITFEVDDVINLEATGLLDLVSDKPMDSGGAASTRASASRIVEPQLEESSKVSVADAFSGW